LIRRQTKSTPDDGGMGRSHWIKGACLQRRTALITLRLTQTREEPNSDRRTVDGERDRRLGPANRDHVWSYDFVQARTHDGRAFRMLTLIDEYKHNTELAYTLLGTVSRTGKIHNQKDLS
jgi:hypothetical protein